MLTIFVIQDHIAVIVCFAKRIALMHCLKYRLHRLVLIRFCVGNIRQNNKLGLAQCMEAIRYVRTLIFIIFTIIFFWNTNCQP